MIRLARYSDVHVSFNSYLKCISASVNQHYVTLSLNTTHMLTLQNKVYAFIAMFSGLGGGGGLQDGVKHVGQLVPTLFIMRTFCRFSSFLCSSYSVDGFGVCAPCGKGLL
jgi:hypothetical protein